MPPRKPKAAPQPPPLDPWQIALNTALSHPSVARLFDRAGGVIEKAGGLLERIGSGELEIPTPKAPTPGRPQEDPRVVLGFGPNELLSVERIKDRKKRLAILCHPDHGGSPEAMARINTAAERLIASLK